MLSKAELWGSNVHVLGRYYQIIAVSLLFMTQGCDHSFSGGEVLAEARWSESDLQELRSALPGIQERCIEILRNEGFDAMPKETDACFEMTDAREWVGLWRYEFEGSRFCPAPTTTCSFESPGDRIWLDVRTIAGDHRMPSDRYGDGKLYQIRFVGRRTETRGAFGHLGSSDHEIIADKLLSIELVEEPELPN